jgi:hypothetical protein
MSALEEIEMMIKMWKKVVKGLEQQNSNLLTVMTEWCKEHPEATAVELVEAVPDLMGVKPSGKGGGNAKDNNAKGSAEVKDRCCAALYARTNGVYADARCKKGNCVRDDGRGNLLCDKCKEKWDEVSSHMMQGNISYGHGKGHTGKAAWAGIWHEDWKQSDVPPVFKGQRCYAEEDGKFNVTEAFKLLKKEQEGGTTWHKSGETWATEEDLAKADAEVDAPADAEVDAPADAEVDAPAELKADSSAPADEDEEVIHEHEGLPYAKKVHKGDTMFYPRWGDNQPSSADADAAWAEIDKSVDADGKWEWTSPEWEDAHNEQKDHLEG